MSKKILKNTTVLLLIFFMIIQIILPSFSNASFSVNSAYTIKVNVVDIYNIGIIIIVDGVI